MIDDIAKMYTFMKVYDASIDALAKMKIPDFKDFQENDVFSAAMYLASGDRGTTTILSEDNLNWITKEVSKRSNSSVNMIPTKFETKYKGLSHLTREYILTNGSEKKKLIFSIQYPPFEFKED